MQLVMVDATPRCSYAGLIYQHSSILLNLQNTEKLAICDLLLTPMLKSFQLQGVCPLTFYRGLCPLEPR